MGPSPWDPLHGTPQVLSMGPLHGTPRVRSMGPPRWDPSMGPRRSARWARGSSRRALLRARASLQTPSMGPLQGTLPWDHPLQGIFPWGPLPPSPPPSLPPSPPPPPPTTTTTFTTTHGTNLAAPAVAGTLSPPTTAAFLSPLTHGTPFSQLCHRLQKSLLSPHTPPRGPLTFAGMPLSPSREPPSLLAHIPLTPVNAADCFMIKCFVKRVVV